MIGPRQRALLERARAAVAPDPVQFAGLLREWGGAGAIDALAPAGFERLMDHLTVLGFRDRARPVLSTATRRLLEEVRETLRVTPHTWTTYLRNSGAGDLRTLTGTGLLRFLSLLEGSRLDVAAFNQLRREITPAQLRLLQVARKQVGLEEVDYYWLLQSLGGVNSAADLDGRGFELVLVALEARGFRRRPAASGGRGYGERPGFASPDQVELIRALWREWSGHEGEAELDVWLERYHRVSSLRFVTRASAGRIITALRAMKARQPARGAHELPVEPPPPLVG